MEKQKRELKGYKIADSVYRSAKKKAEKNDKKLAQLIEQFVYDFNGGRFVFDGNRVAGVVKKFQPETVSRGTSLKPNS